MRKKPRTTRLTDQPISLRLPPDLRERIDALAPRIGALPVCAERYRLPVAAHDTASSSLKNLPAPRVTVSLADLRHGYGTDGARWPAAETLAIATW